MPEALFLLYHISILIAVVAEKEIVHLVGYKLVFGYPIKTIVDATPARCGAECWALEPDKFCVGFRMFPNQTCLLVEALQNIVEDPICCTDYATNRTGFIFTEYGSDWTVIEQLVFFNNINDGLACPYNWVYHVSPYQCLWTESKTFCDSYNPIMRIKYNSQGKCEILPSCSGKCPAGWKVFNYHVHQCICYGWVTVPAGQTLAYYDQLCAQNTTGSRIPSIRDYREQAFVDSYWSPYFLGLHVPPDKPYSNTSFEWFDGTPLDFTAWASGQPGGAGKYVYVSGGKWYDTASVTDTWFACRLSVIY